MKKKLITSAIGYLGRHDVQEFKKHGFQVHPLARNAAKRENLSEYINEKFIGELTDSNSLLGVSADINCVFICHKTACYMKHASLFLP